MYIKLSHTKHATKCTLDTINARPRNTEPVQCTTTITRSTVRVHYRL